MKSGPLILLFFLCFALMPVSAFGGGLVNESNQNEEIEILHKDGRTNRVVMYPGQSLSLPKDTAQVQVLQRAYDRGDETVKVMVTESDGRVGMLEGRGESYTLNLPEDAEVAAAALRVGYVTNDGNIAVKVKITNRSGVSNEHELFLNQTVTLDTNVEAVEVMSNPRVSGMRGDEEVKVGVLLPDGTASIITAIGGRLHVKEEE